MIIISLVFEMEPSTGIIRFDFTLCEIPLRNKLRKGSNHAVPIVSWKIMNVLVAFLWQLRRCGVIALDTNATGLGEESFSEGEKQVKCDSILN